MTKILFVDLSPFDANGSFVIASPFSMSFDVHLVHIFWLLMILTLQWCLVLVDVDDAVDVALPLQSNR